LISSEEFVLTSLKPNGLQLYKLDQYCFQSKRWCLFQTLMILLTKKLQTIGNKTKKVLLKRQKNGLCNMLVNEYNIWHSYPDEK
jgi:predicted Rdx family selenoprotein